MPFAEPPPPAGVIDAFIALCGETAWSERLSDFSSPY